MLRAARQAHAESFRFFVHSFCKHVLDYTLTSRLIERASVPLVAALVWLTVLVVSTCLAAARLALNQGAEPRLCVYVSWAILAP